MNPIPHGPFSFDPSPRSTRVSGELRRKWTLRYGLDELAEKILSSDLNQSQIRDEFADEINAFTLACRKKYAPDRISLTKAAPPLGWIAGLLPEDVMTTDPAHWRPPMSWEIRHIVGEGSFTETTGNLAAQLVGVSPQNFRKYTARSDAPTRQNISYAMWHLLLHRLGVQYVSTAEILK